jgi:tyrosyl-tRNA synthetase
MNTIIDVLKQRGLFADMTSPELPVRVQKSMVIYAGFDPSSNSLQVGNLIAVMALAHCQRCGHRVIAVAGGATGMIGDPSGKSAERNLLGAAEVERNLAGIRENLSRFLDFNHPTAPARIVNNNDWLGKFSYIEFLRDVGKHFRMGAMLGKESVRSRMDASEEGMSYAEFSYQLLQAYDFLHLYDAEGCTMQIGGSDQWGNITAGIDLIRKLRSVEVFGLTIPLVCDSAGRKFGKSEGNAIYLSRERTSCYEFYQFFVRTADADVVKLLKLLTFLPLEEIAALEQEVKKDPDKRVAARRLADEVTRMVHGEDGLKLAQKASSVLFGESMEGLKAADLIRIFADVPSVSLARGKAEGLSFLDLAVQSGMSKSKGEARRLIENGGCYCNNRRVESVESKMAQGDLVEGQLTVLRSGKKNYFLVKWE